MESEKRAIRAVKLTDINTRENQTAAQSSIEGPSSTSEENNSTPCMKAAMKLLAFCDRSEKALTEKLLEKGFDKDEIRDVVIRLKEKKYLSDRRLMEEKIRFLANRKFYGLRKIELELARYFGLRSVKLYKEEALLKIEGDVDFFENARTLASSLARKGKERMYILSKLKNNGFSSEEIRYALEELGRAQKQ